ncbi:MAG: DUF4062 domain-containing protein [Clostridia bacterium]|nr:DUF4062 domain-containing protein [Clostridia bacterium]
MQKKKYQVFVSSTYTDLKEERLAVTQCLLDNDCIPVGMEQFPAIGMSQMEYIEKMLDDCDYYLLILAGRYGSCDDDGIGYTEKEFDYALKNGIPVIAFVVDDIENLPGKKCEQTDTGREKLNDFRTKVCKGRMVKFYSNVDDLKAKVVTSINHCKNYIPRIGWVRADSLQKEDNDIEEKIASYIDSHIISKDEIDQLFDKTVVMDGGNAEGHANESRIKSPPVIQRTYSNADISGSFTFDYSNNDGQYTIGSGKYAFATKWTKASDRAIYAYKDGAGIEGIARIKNCSDLKYAIEMKCDFSSRVRTPEIGDIIIWKNKYGHFAATRIVSILDDSRGADHDELMPMRSTCERICGGGKRKRPRLYAPSVSSCSRMSLSSVDLLMFNSLASWALFTSRRM